MVDGDQGRDEPAQPPTDLGSAALAAAKRAALEKLGDATRIRRQQESAGASTQRRESARGKRRRAGDRTDWDDPAPLGAAVSELLSARGWDGELAVAKVLGDWASIVGDDIAARATPVSLRDGVLSVQAESTAWATQLRLLAPQLVAAISAKLGPDVVREIQSRGPSGPPTKPGQWKVKGSRGPRDTYG